MKVLFLFLSLFIFHFSFAEIAMEKSEQERLEIMLQERKSLFHAYSGQLEKKSGIFGRRNKKDEAEANQILEKVIIKDNAIFRELERLLDQRQFETKTLGQRMMQQDERLTTHTESNEKLLNTLKAEKLGHESLKKKLSRSKLKLVLSLILNVLFAGMIFYLYFAFRKKKYEGIN